MQPIIYIMLNKAGKRRDYAQIAHWQNDELQHYDIWPLNEKADTNVFDAKPNAIGNIYLCRIVKQDQKTKTAFVSIGKFDGVLKLKPNQTFTDGQYIYAQIIADGFQDKLLKLRFEGDAPKAKNNKPKLYKKAPDLAQVYVKYAHDHGCKIQTDDFALFSALTQQLNPSETGAHLLPVQMSSINKPDLFEVHGLSDQVEQLTSPKIMLSNGANIIIQHTEAMTVVDVNSGQYKKSSKQMVADINYEAADVILKQLMLRQIGGLVIVDFLKYVTKTEKLKFTNYLLELAKLHKIQLGSYTKFGLAEFKITRTSQSLVEKLRSL